MPVQPSDGNELFFIYSCFPTVILKFDEHSGQSTKWRDRPVRDNLTATSHEHLESNPDQEHAARSGIRNSIQHDLN
jgi:hypothetical protein